MTQPDGLFPDSAANSGSLADLAATTEADQMATITGQATSGHQSTLNSLFDGLTTGLPFPVAFLIKIIETILGFIPGGSILVDIVNEVQDFISDPLTTVENIPILGPLVKQLIQIFTGDPNATGGADPIGFLGNVVKDILSMLGLGTGTEGTGTQGFDLFGSITNFVNGLLQSAGVVTTQTPIPANQIVSLSPGSGPNVQHDHSFITPNSIQGQGLWTWDWPGPNGGNWDASGGCVRTVRPGLITIFWVTGIWEQISGGSAIHLDIPGGGGIGDVAGRIEDLMSDQTVSQANWLHAVATGNVAVPMTPGGNIIDWERFEVIFVPYAGAMYPMGYSINQGVSTLISLIKSIPGKFILMGGSMGGVVTSKVFQEIVSPTGVLHSRNSDLLMGWSGASPMRAEGATWPGNPLAVGPGHGCLHENLHTTDPRWWEWSATTGGPYPAFGDPEGIVWPYGDPISCLGDDVLSEEVRTLVDTSYSVKKVTANDTNEFFLMLIGDLLFHPDASNVLLGIGFNVLASPHGLGWWTIQPFLSQGDTRTFWRYSIDYIVDNYGPLVSPPLVGIHHQFEGTLFPVAPYQVVRATCSVKWMNVVASGPAIMLAVNAYDANGNLITGPGGTTPTVTATTSTISDPESDANWQELEASFVVPAGSAKACMVFDVSPEASTTGTVWFAEGEFEITSRIDSALLANLANFPQILASKVGGVQGEADMLTAIQNLIDGATSANAGVALTDVQLAALFNSQGITASNAASALELAVAHEQALGVSINEPVYGGLSPTGEVTFELQTLPQGSTLPTTTISAGTALAGFITCKKAVLKGFIEFVAHGAGTSTGIYVNVYRVDPVSGNWTNVWTSSNIGASIPNATDGWVGVNIPDGQEISVTQGELVAIEIVAQGSTISVVSKTTGLPNKTAIPRNYGATRTTASTGGVSPATLTESTPTYASTWPFVAFGIRNIPPAFEPPNQEAFDVAGRHTFTIPDWAQNAGIKFDVVALGSGGSGGPPAFFIIPGMGGLPGAWAASTFTYGTDIPLGTTELAVRVAHGGPVGHLSGMFMDGFKSSVGYATNTPEFDAVSGAHNNGTSVSWTHTATAGSYVVVSVSYWSFGGNPTSVTYNGVAMTQLATQARAFFGGLVMFGIASVPGGAKTVTVTFAGSTLITAGAVSYTGVASPGTPQLGTKAGLTWGRAECGAGQIIVQSYGDYEGTFTSPGFWPPSATWANRLLDICPGGVFGPVAPLSIGDSVDSGRFTVTNFPYLYDTPNGDWASIALPLNGSGATTLLSAAGGESAGNTDALGIGAGSQNYNGRNYFGGPDVAVGIGSLPGGGGPGGPGFSEGGMPGGDAEVWITARQP